MQDSNSNNSPSSNPVSNPPNNPENSPANHLQPSSPDPSTKKTGGLLKNCHDTTALISRSHEEPLVLSDKFFLHVHLMLCGACRDFYKNSNTISQMIQEHKMQENDLHMQMNGNESES